jgi:hypothetical protein
MNGQYFIYNMIQAIFVRTKQKKICLKSTSWLLL